MIPMGGIEGARECEELTPIDEVLILVFDILRSRFNPILSEERARNLVCAFGCSGEEPPREVIRESLAIARRGDHGLVELSDEELEILTSQILELFVAIKLF